jgi:hypothetical protein
MVLLFGGRGRKGVYAYACALRTVCNISPRKVCPLPPGNMHAGQSSAAVLAERTGGGRCHLPPPSAAVPSLLPPDISAGHLCTVM